MAENLNFRKVVGLFIVCSCAFLLFPYFSFAQVYGVGNYSSSTYGGGTNIPPVISLTTPTNGQSFTENTSVTITASSSDSDGSVVAVAFYIDGQSIGTSSSPYTVDWSADEVGAHSVQAVAVDNGGAYATATISITVTAVSSGGGGGGSRSNSASSGSASSTTISTTTLSGAELIASLQKKIIELTAILAQIKAGNNQMPYTTNPLKGYVFTINLTVGVEHPDVQKLQKFLNARGYTVSPSGAGSPGQESVYFGQLTREALAVFQSQNSIVPAVGYFGPVTRTRVNSLNQ